MIRVKVDELTYLEVDFQGLLSKSEEEVSAYRFTGNNCKSIGLILQKSHKTVQKQQARAYEKLDLNGLDNPLAILQVRSFQKGWAKLVLAPQEVQIKDFQYPLFPCEEITNQKSELLRCL